MYIRCSTTHVRTYLKPKILSPSPQAVLDIGHIMGQWLSGVKVTFFLLAETFQQFFFLADAGGGDNDDWNK